jgi:PilZ domain
MAGGLEGPGCKATMMPSSMTARRWRRYHLDLPVQVMFCKGSERIVVSGRGTELGRGGMALDAGVSLERGDLIEVDFQTPSRLHVTGIIRNRAGHRFGVEFLTPLLS